MATKKAAKTAKKVATKRPAAKKAVAKKANGSGAKKTAKKTTGSSGKRELIAPRGDKRYIRRDERGRIVESDDQGRSLSQDVRKPAKTKVPAGMGDRGDQKHRK